MHNFIKQSVKISLVLISLCIALPTHAASFFMTDDIMFPANGQWNWIYFGGCEIDHQCIKNGDLDYHDVTYRSGDFNVKQGMYILNKPDTVNVTGKLVLKYSYKLDSEEDTNSQSIDRGFIKVKDVATNHIYYLQTLSPANADGKYHGKRIVFPSNLVARKLQLVFETLNDNKLLTTLSVTNVSFQHISSPSITGNITYHSNDKIYRADGAVVNLLNQDGSTIFQTTKADKYGNYTFYPVQPKQYYLVSATLNNYSGSQALADKTKNGVQNTVDLILK